MCWLLRSAVATTTRPSRSGRTGNRRLRCGRFGSKLTTVHGHAVGRRWLGLSVSPCSCLRGSGRSRRSTTACRNWRRRRWPSPKRCNSPPRHPQSAPARRCQRRRPLRHPKRLWVPHQRPRRSWRLLSEWPPPQRLLLPPPPRKTCHRCSESSPPRHLRLPSPLWRLPALRRNCLRRGRRWHRWHRWRRRQHVRPLLHRCSRQPGPWPRPLPLQQGCRHRRSERLRRLRRRRQACRFRGRCR